VGLKFIDLNADVGEGFPHDEELLQVVSSANICVGGYAGGAELCAETRERAGSLGVRVGAHIGFPDRPNFGRILIAEGLPDTWIDYVVRKIGESHGFAYIKPHGALYHWLADEQLGGWDRVWKALEQRNLPVMGLPKTEHENQSTQRHLEFIAEGFAERGYTKDLRLIPRGLPDAELTDLERIGGQALALAGFVQSICVHGDRPDAVLVARHVRKSLADAEISIGFGE
jgi:UPF0271 protein